MGARGHSVKLQGGSSSNLALAGMPSGEGWGGVKQESSQVQFGCGELGAKSTRQEVEWTAGYIIEMQERSEGRGEGTSESLSCCLSAVFQAISGYDFNVEEVDGEERNMAGLRELRFGGL